MDNTIGYGTTSQHLASFVRRDKLGMAALCGWLECCVSEFQIDLVLLEPRIANLCQAVQIW